MFKEIFYISILHQRLELCAGISLAGRLMSIIEPHHHKRVPAIQGVLYIWTLLFRLPRLLYIGTRMLGSSI